MYINYNGVEIAADEPLFNSENRAFCYGDSVFESMRFSAGRILFLEDHLERLAKGMKYLKLQLPKDHNHDFFKDTICNLAKKNKIASDARIRLQVFRNGGGFYTPASFDASFVITIKPLNEAAFTLNDKGIKIDSFTDETKTLGLLSQLKTTSCLIYILASLHAIKNNLDQSLILNADGAIAEAGNSNIFILSNNTFITPSREEGGIPGVMQKQIISIIKEKGHDLEERRIFPDELLTADEVFLTNAVQGVQWVLAYKNKRYFNAHSRKLIEWLNQKVKYVGAQET